MVSEELPIPIVWLHDYHLMLGIIHILRNLTFMLFGPPLPPQFLRWKIKLWYVPKNDFLFTSLNGEQLLTMILFDFEQRKKYFLKLGSVPLVVILRNTYTSSKHINSVIHLILYTQVRNGIVLQYVDFLHWKISI